VNAFDRLLGVRVLSATAAAWLAASGVVVLTDEASSTFGMRLARLAALGPLVSALSILAVTAHARARGELASLAALGAPPWTAARGAMWGGLVTAGVATLVLLSPWTEPTSLFPVVHHAIVWDVEAGSAMARAEGIVVASNGALRLAASSAIAAAAAPGATSAFVCLTPMVLAVPHWAVTPMPALVRSAAVLTGTAALLVSLHLIAAGSVSPLAGLFAALPLTLSATYFRAREVRP
jgi:hypothetical protein